MIIGTIFVLISTYIPRKKKEKKRKNNLKRKCFDVNLVPNQKNFIIKQIIVDNDKTKDVRPDLVHIKEPAAVFIYLKIKRNKITKMF